MRKHLSLMFLLMGTTLSHGSDVAIFEDQPVPKTAKEAHLQAKSFLTALKYLKSTFDTELNTFLSQNRDRKDAVHKIEFIETRLDGLGNSISAIEKELQDLQTIPQVDASLSSRFYLSDIFYSFFPCFAPRKLPENNVSPIKTALQKLKPSFKFEEYVFYYQDPQTGTPLPFTLLTTPKEAPQKEIEKYGTPKGCEILYAQTEEPKLILFPLIPSTSHIASKHTQLAMGTTQETALQNIFSWHWPENHYLRVNSKKRVSIQKMMKNIFSWNWSDTPNAYTIEYNDQAQGSIEISGDPTTLLRIRSNIFSLINSIKKS